MDRKKSASFPLQSDAFCFHQDEDGCYNYCPYHMLISLSFNLQIKLCILSPLLIYYRFFINYYFNFKKLNIWSENSRDNLFQLLVQTPASSDGYRFAYCCKWDSLQL